MTSSEFQERLAARVEKAGVAVSVDARIQLEVYFELLTRWNAKINLTALPLHKPTDETFDRLLIEPLAAARYVADSARLWFDVGSGGGSPAIPLKILHPRLELTMVESRVRKAAFLREVVRSLELQGVKVANHRFEEVAGTVGPHTIDLVSVRAVKTAPALLVSIHRVLARAGRAFFFRTRSQTAEPSAGFAIVEVIPLGTLRETQLSILAPTSAK